MLSLILDSHSTVRLFLFLLAVALFGCWELIRPRRELSISKLLRWTNNWLLSILNSVLLSLVFPVLAVGVAFLAQEHGWGILHALDLHPALSIVLFMLLFDLAIYWQHRVYHMVPFLWRLHRIHHSVIPEETNSNFGFNFPWWDRLFGSYSRGKGSESLPSVVIAKLRDKQGILLNLVDDSMLIVDSPGPVD